MTASAAGDVSVKERVQGRIFPSEISAEIEIEAPAETVWHVLMDFDKYSEWNDFCPSVTTDFQLGSAVNMQVRLVVGKKPMRQVEYLNMVEPGYRFAWGYSMGGALILQANRYQVVEDLGSGRSRYFTTDQFSGLLVPVMNLLYAKHIKLGFDDTARGLKARAESLV
jgi:hypothetical protein